jgi:predicted transporter
MMNVTNIAIVGIVLSILVFGIKTGLGCGFANLRKHEIIMVCAVYLVICVIMGFLIGYLSVDSLGNISGIGISFHILLALLMIIAGIYTQKQWNCGRDVSRRTFIFLSLPCPICLSALFIACTMLASTLEWSGFIIGIIVGSIFFLSALTSSFVFRSLGKTPQTLGDLMMFIGIFYVLGAVLIPAYIQTKTITSPSFSVDIGATLISFIIFFIFIAAGFIIHRGVEQ